MARQKRSSPLLEKAERRLAGLNSIDPELAFGGNLTLANYREQIAAVRDRLEAYNQLLSTLDGVLNDLEASETELNDLSTRFLAGVAAVYGKDSNEYEMAGGTRSSERQRPARSNAAE